MQSGQLILSLIFSDYLEDDAPVQQWMVIMWIRLMIGEAQGLDGLESWGSWVKQAVELDFGQIGLGNVLVERCHPFLSSPPHPQPLKVVD